VTVSEAGPPSWSDGTHASIWVWAHSTSHDELVITPSVDYIGWFVLTHAASGLSLLNVADVEEGLDKAARLRGVSFAEPGEPGSPERRRLAEQVRAALRGGAA
jgi:hypothetical protein